MNNVVKLENVCFGYEDGNEVLKNFNLTINEGEFVTILGHNGSGKSTLSKLLVGLHEIQGRKIIIDGQPLTESSVFDIRQKVGIVFQNPDNQFVGCTVRDDIAFGLENKCVPYEEMDNLVNKYAQEVGMGDFLNFEPHYLSGGEKQRVAIAGVLALGAKIIILDEATAMLDPQGREDMMKLIHELVKNRDKTIIMITHYLDEAIHSDRIIVMNEGKIILEGKPKDVFKEKELLESVKLDVPFAVKVSYELTKRGVLSEIVTSDEELMNELCKLNLNL
ncbi:energy-coupling factor transporter ATPase [Turicibacter sp. TA25]|uniref:energy-coupling factor transporter ATPase n=1 Tax=Turicibacter sp. TA25 TaxID=2951142 RepID=UPI0021D4E150|nr:energy-coupling factor transporter ATPase [Turicibacter sp. TA25]MCU7205303.1 energy-coupling factor transporter ATPase [Turicibacter sp. TA25]